VPDLSLVASLARRAESAPARAGGCRVVAVDGPSGAGKSTLADALAAHLSAQVVRVDDLIPGWDGIDVAAPIVVRDILEPLARGEDGGFRRYDWDRKQYAEWQAVPRAAYVVVEGCASGSRIAAPYLSLLVWVDAPIALRFERGMARDGETFRPYWERWEEQTDALFAAEGTRDRADVVVDGRPSQPGTD
jgi:energy-coupling factor transporter ATP-binding protein EcfA2